MIKIFAVCEGCKKRRLIIKNQKIILPTNEIATSKKLFCHRCQEVIQKSLNI